MEEAILKTEKGEEEDSLSGSGEGSDLASSDAPSTTETKSVDAPKPPPPPPVDPEKERSELIAKLQLHNLDFSRPIPADYREALMKALQYEEFQFTALENLNEIIAMGTEETLGGFPTKQLLLALSNILSGPFSMFETQLLIFRILSHLLEALPQSANIFSRSNMISVISKTITSSLFEGSIDIAESGVNLLCRLSETQAIFCLKGGALEAIFNFFGFFPDNARRKALNIAANICLQITPDNYDSVNVIFEQLREVIDTTDTKMLDPTLTCLYRLIDIFQSDQKKLDAICSGNLGPKLMKVISSGLNSNTLCLALKTINSLCRSVDKLKEFVNSGLCEILSKILVDFLRETSRSPKPSPHLNETVSLINELLPSLPSEITGFAIIGDKSTTVNTYLQRFPNFGQYLQQQELPAIPNETPKDDPRLSLFESSSFIQKIADPLFTPLFKIFNIFHNSPTRYKCISALTKLVTWLEPGDLKSHLKDLEYSSLIARLLADKELTMVAVAVYLAEISMDKLGDVLREYFIREGVIHELEKKPEERPIPPAPPSTNTSASRREVLIKKLGEQLFEAPLLNVSSGKSPSWNPFDALNDETEEKKEEDIEVKPTEEKISKEPLPLENNQKGSTPQTTEQTEKPQEPATETKSEVKQETTPSEAEAKPETATEAKPEITSEPTSEVKSEAKPEIKSEPTPAQPKSDNSEPIPAEPKSDNSQPTPETKPELKSEPTPEEPKSDSSQSTPETKESKLRTIPNPRSVTPKTPKVDVRDWLHNHVRDFRNKYFNGDFSAKSEDFVKLKLECEKLTSLVKENGDLSHIEKSLNEIAQTLSNGISDFEFASSGCTTALITLFTYSVSEDRKQSEKLCKKRILAFSKAFLVARSSSPFISLIKVLRQTASSAESSYPLFLHGSSAGSLRALTRTFKVNLKRDPTETKLFEYTNNPVDLFPLATITNVENFLKERVTKKTVTPAPPVAERVKLLEEIQQARKERQKRTSKKLPKEKETNSDSNKDGTNKDVESIKKPETDGKQDLKEEVKLVELPSTQQENVTKTDEQDKKEETVVEKKEDPISEKKEQIVGKEETVVEKKEETISEKKEAIEVEPKKDETVVEKKEEPISEKKEQIVVKEVVEEKKEETVVEKKEEIAVKESVEEKKEENKGELIEEKQQIESQEIEKEATKEKTEQIGEASQEENQQASETPKAETKEKEKPAKKDKTNDSSFKKHKKSFKKVADEMDAKLKSVKEKKTPAESENIVLKPNEKISVMIDGKALTNPKQTFFQIFQNMSSKESGNIRSSNPLATQNIWEKSYEITYKIEEIETNKSQSIDTFDEISTSPLLEFIRMLPTILEFNNSSLIDPSSTLLWITSYLNGIIPILFKEPHGTNLSPISPLSEAQFFNPVLSNKLSRQIQDLVTICSGAFPEWFKSIELYPQLFSEENRISYFKATSFGIPRALKSLSVDNTLLSESGNSRAGGDIPLPRSKFRINRNNILASAKQIMEVASKNPKLLIQVEYFGEPGVGLGPTKEFYTLASKEIQRKDADMWLAENFVSETTEIIPGVRTEQFFVVAPWGLFPKPIELCADPTKVINNFRFLGRLVGKALLDDRLLDIPFSEAFYKVLLGRKLTIHELVTVLPYLKHISDMAKLASKKRSILANKALSEEERNKALKSLLYKDKPVEAMLLYFTDPSNTVPLIENGENVEVTLENLDEYIIRLSDFYLNKGIQKQMNAFKEGFEQFVPLERLKIFSPPELDRLLCGVTQKLENWTVSEIMDNTKFDQNLNIRVVTDLVNVLVSFTPEQKRKFLIFLTGSPRLPIGGFKNLKPKFTVQRQPNVDDSYLPSVNTCFLTMKMPEYSSIELLREKLLQAMYNQHLNFLRT